MLRSDRFRIRCDTAPAERAALMPDAAERAGCAIVDTLR
jgi:hypothetical protein